MRVFAERKSASMLRAHAAGTTTEFPTLTDGVFGVAGGTSSRLLAAPLLRCVYYCAFLVLFIGGFTKASPIYIKGI